MRGGDGFHGFISGSSTNFPFRSMTTMGPRREEVNFSRGTTCLLRSSSRISVWERILPCRSVYVVAPSGGGCVCPFWDGGGVCGRDTSVRYWHSIHSSKIPSTGTIQVWILRGGVSAGPILDISFKREARAPAVMLSVGNVTTRPPRPGGMARTCWCNQAYFVRPSNNLMCRGISSTCRMWISGGGCNWDFISLVSLRALPAGRRCARVGFRDQG